MIARLIFVLLLVSPCLAQSNLPTERNQPTYFATVVASAAAANKDHINLFNASSSGRVIRILKITAAADYSAAVTGLNQSLRLSISSTAGSSCTSITARAMDTANAALPAQVTASTNCTTDPTVSYDYSAAVISGEETIAADPEGEIYTFKDNGGQPLTLREGQGISIKSTGLSGAFPVTITITFTCRSQ